MVTYQFAQHKEKKIITIIFSYRKNWEEGEKKLPEAKWSPTIFEYK